MSSINNTKGGVISFILAELFPDSEAVASYELIVDGESYILKASDISNGTLQFKLPALCAGNKAGRIYALDDQGTRRETADVSFTVADNKAPLLTGKLEMYQEIVGGEEGFVLDWESAEDESACLYKVEIKDGKTVVYSLAGISETSAFVSFDQLKTYIADENISKKLSSKKYTATVEAYQVEGTIYSKKLTASAAALDTVAPEVQEDFSISLDSSVNNVKKSTLSISGIESVFEDNFGVASYELKVNGKSFKLKASAVKNDTLTFTLPALSSGTATGKLYALDAKGNRSEAVEVTFDVADKKAPRLTGKLSMVQTLIEGEDAFDFSWQQAYDADGAELEYTLVILCGKDVVYTATLAGTETFHSVLLSELEGVTGKKLTATITAYQCDDESVKSKTLKSSCNIKDITPPEQVEGLSVGTATDKAAVLYWAAATDNAGSVTYEIKVDGKTYTSKTTTLTVKGLSSGPHTFTVTAVDQSKNKSSVSESFTFDVVSTTFKEANPALPSIKVNGLNKTFTGMSQAVEDKLEKKEEIIWDLYNKGEITWEEAEKRRRELYKDHTFGDIKGTSANDKVIFKYECDVSSIDLGDGDDQIILSASSADNETELGAPFLYGEENEEFPKGCLDFGNGNDVMQILKNAEIFNYSVYFGEGDDLLYVADNAGGVEFLEISFGAGNDIFYVGKNVEDVFDCIINFGDGDDRAVLNAGLDICSISLWAPHTYDHNKFHFGSGNDFLQVNAGSANIFIDRINFGEDQDTLELNGTLIAGSITGLDKVTGAGCVAFWELDDVSLSALSNAPGVELVKAGVGFTSKAQELSDNDISGATKLSSKGGTFWLAGSESEAAQGEYGFADETDWIEVNLKGCEELYLQGSYHYDYSWDAEYNGDRYWKEDSVTFNIYNSNKELVHTATGYVSWSEHDDPEYAEFDLRQLGSKCYIEMTIDSTTYGCVYAEVDYN